MRPLHYNRHYTPFGERIKHALHQLDLNWSWLARELDVTPATIHKWITGAKRPTPARVRQIAKAIGCDAAELQDLLDNPPPQDHATN